MKSGLMIVSVLLIAATVAAASDNIATLRGIAIDEERDPPKMANVKDDERGTRSYPMQPPVIPHAINNYRVDINSNKCLSCHSRKQTDASEAPMVSVTHYMDRDGNFLADVSPRRYFCEQCHVVQTNAATLVGNDFKDIDQLLREAK